MTDPSTKLPGSPPADLPQRLFHLVDILPAALLCLDRNWYITYANAEAMRISRLEPASIGTRTHWELYPETVGSEIEREYRLVMETRQPRRFETYYEPFGVRYDIHILPTDEGIALYYHDITAERSAETAQRLAEASERKQADRLNQVFDATSDAIATLDREWRYTYLNAAARKLIDPEDRLIGKNLWVEFPIAAEGPAWDTYHRTMNDRVTAQTEIYYPEPINRWLSLISHPTPDGIVVFFRDITEQRTHDQVVAARTELLAVVQNASRLATWDLDPATGHIQWGPGSFDVFGHPLAELDSFAALERIVFRNEDTLRQRIDEAINNGALFVTEFAVRARDGATIWVEARGQAVPRYDGAPRLRGMVIDITQRKLDEERLESQRAELESVYETAPIGLALFDPVEFRYLRLNERQAQIVGLPKSQILGRTLTEIAPIPGLREMFEQVAEGNPIRNQLLEGELPSTPGEHRYWTVNYFPVYAPDGSVQAITAASLEITNQKKSEAALIQSEKLAAVGRLASSISHEINNPLEAITNLLYLIAMDDGLPPDVKSYVHMAQSELSRVSQIATQTLRFHRQAVAPTSVTAADLVDAVIHLYTGRLSNSSITIDARYDTDTRILCFENDIRQVLNNLIANAIDAMRKGGRLIVRAHAVHDLVPELDAPRPGVRITIADTGHGMDASTLARIFEPFFTTKDLNGTGLGLWISKGIVERHQGRLRARSSNRTGHHGTVFTLFLPCEEGTTL